MKWPVGCIGCATKLRKHDTAIHVQQTDDAGVTTTQSVCEPCLVRFVHDPAFAARFEQLSSILKGSIEA